MRKLSFFIIALLISLANCQAQQLTLKYIGNKYYGIQNKSFVNNELLFLSGNDTVKINLKLPFKFKKKKAIIFYSGIYYNCHLKNDTTYTITLKKICVDSIPKDYNSYYILNTIPDKNDCSKFIEIKKDTEYKYYGNYEKYVDINNTLYEIIGLSPSNDCFFPH